MTDNQKLDGVVTNPDPLAEVFLRLVSIEYRLAVLENRVTSPAICPDPTDEGSAWQGEAAPGSDAEHPPIGYEIEDVGVRICEGAMAWKKPNGPWTKIPAEVIACPFHNVVRRGGLPVANPIIPPNPIPPAEIDRDPRDAEIAELRATVERLTAERDELRGKLAKIAEVVG